MNILIESSSLTNANSIRGVGRYTRELIGALTKLTSSHNFFTSQEKHSVTIDLIHYPFFDLFFPTLPMFHSAPAVVTIHDVIPLVFPSHYPKGVKGTLAFFRQRLALRSVAHIITDSLCSKRDIEQHLHLASDTITPVPLAASPLIQKVNQSTIEAVRKKYAIPKNYFLYVGDLNYNKNLLFLLSVVSKIPKTNLVMVGSQLQNTSIPEGKALHNLIATAGLTSRVYLLHSLGSESSVELSALYSGAVAYIQPSLYEGFGLPVLEAFTAGTVVLSSCGGSLPEVVGEAALTFHPMDEQTLEMSMRKVLRMSEVERRSWIKKGTEQARQFSWERTAEATLAVYEQVTKKR